MSNDMPPGCSVNDIPGNTPEDTRFEKLCGDLTVLWYSNLSLFGTRLSDEGLEILANWARQRENKAFDTGYEAGESDART